MSQLRVGAVVHARLRRRERSLGPALARLRERTRLVAELDTRGDDVDIRAVVELLREAEPDVLVAAGGDGTAGTALRALLEAKRSEQTALAFLPLGTGNNAARSFGLRALREGADTLEQALAAIDAGARRAVDVGLLDGHAFLGSVTFGMDAEVLALRNRIQRRLSGRGGGYGLYAASGVASLLTGTRAAWTRLSLDGSSETRSICNLAVVNAPVYAGPLRFDGENDCADGLLDVHAVSSGFEYVSEAAKACLRYLRVRRGAQAPPSPLLRRAREIQVEFERPLTAQADGEEIAPSAAFRIGVLPSALWICVPTEVRGR